MSQAQVVDLLKRQGDDTDHREVNASRDGPGVAPKVARQVSIAADPCQGSLDDPSLGKTQPGHRHLRREGHRGWSQIVLDVF